MIYSKLKLLALFCVTIGSGCSDTGGVVGVSTFAHTCILRSNGGVRCGGDGTHGQLGHGNTDIIGNAPTLEAAGDIPFGGTATHVAVGHQHTCVLLDTGNVRCWGRNFSGQLGYGNQENIGDNETAASAGDVPLGGIATALSAGSQHTCALLESGAIRCWGSGNHGALGYGNTTTIGDDEPASVAGDVPLGGPAIAIAAGMNHTCALMENGAVRCWGWNQNGQLGYGHTNSIGDNEPASSAGDVPLGAHVVAISAGVAHTCALLNTGKVRCWGLNGDGQLGYGHTNTLGDDDFPETAGDVPLGGTAVAISAGLGHTCALMDSSAVRCWGRGAEGQLRYDNLESIGDDEPANEAGDFFVGAIAISAGILHSCAVMDTHAVRCWGKGVSIGLFGPIPYPYYKTNDRLVGF